MKGSTRVAKGRIEEAAGALTGNGRLRAKGIADQAVGRVKQVVEKGVKQAKKCAAEVKSKARKTARNAVD
jgi:uncharacterized protein YjbJ (UPF0337 family)